MKIGMVTAVYKPVVNGVTRMVSLLKRDLQTAGHEVTIFTFGEPDPAGEESGVVRSPAISLGDTGYYFSVRYNRAAQEQLRQMDILHCHHLLMGVEMAHRYGSCPIVYTNHTRYDLYSNVYMPLPQPAADAIMRQLWPEFADFCDVVVTPSESVQAVMRDFGVRRPIVVIPNGIELEPYWQPERVLTKTALTVPETAVLLIYVGRLSAEKNLETLLGQFAIAQNIVPELHLVLVGRGPLQQTLKQQAGQLGVGHHVHFTGVVPAEMIPAYLAAADLFVTASLSEVHPLTVIEAMAAGLPIAAVAAPGISDLVCPAETGLLTDHVEGGLAAVITALALNKALRQRMGTAARLKSQEYDIRRTVSQTMDLYESLLETRPDLQRRKRHGGWRRTWQGVQPLMEQLARLLRPPEHLRRRNDGR
jgi:1,2-diacylglycerol 3-alpha-glucosyltransferase